MAASAAMTKEELKAALSLKGGISAPASARKDELLALYEEHVSNTKIAEFSADDETQGGEDQPIALKKRNGSKKHVAAMAVNNSLFEIENLNDDQLAEALINRGLEVGPIVDSTRSLYRKKLANYLKDEENVNGKVANGDGDVKHNGAAEFSADDEEVNGSEEVTKEDEVEEEEEEDEEETETEDEQPSIQVKKVSNKGSKSAQKAAENTSPLASLRQRFLGDGTKINDTTGQRFTPTPRRSIHSYKVTETTKQTMTKNPDGSITRDYDYKKVTSDDKGIIGGSTRIYTILKMLPGFFLLLIAIVLAYYIYSKRK